MEKQFNLRKEISSNMENQINKLHNRHVAKILTQLNEIKAPQIIIDAVKRQFSYYTTDIKEQVLTSNSNQYDKSNKA
jgi:hypothetical protein